METLLKNKNITEASSSDVERPVRFGSVNRALSLLALESTGKESLIGLEQQREEIVSCIRGYILGSNALEYFNENRSFLRDEDVSEIFKAKQLIDNGQGVDKNAALLKSYMNFMHRIASRELIVAGNRISENKFSRLKHILKVDYIMSLNGQITEYLNSVSSTNNSIGKLKTALAVYYKSAIVGLADVGYVKSDQSHLRFDDLSEFNKIYDVIEGMRHEAAFKELISEIEDGSVEVMETTDEADSHGIDMVLKVKLSRNSKEIERQTIASASDIENDNYFEVYLPVDIKSTEFSANMTLEKQKSFNDHWVIWSNIYKEDFKLSYTKSGPFFKYKENDAPIFLSINEQLKAMQELESSGLYYEGENGGFKPPNIKRRIYMIKKEILAGIKALMRANVDLSDIPDYVQSA